MGSKQRIGSSVQPAAPVSEQGSEGGSVQLSSEGVISPEGASQLQGSLGNSGVSALVQLETAPGALVQLDGETPEETAGDGGEAEVELTPIEQWDQLLDGPDVGSEEILSWAAWQWGEDSDVAVQILEDDARRTKLLNKVGAQGAPTLMLYWHVGITEVEGRQLENAVIWCRDAGGLDSAGWARLVAAKTAEQCARVIACDESFQVVRALAGDPVVLFPALSEDPLTLKQVMTDHPRFVAWLRDVGGEARVQQIRDYCQMAEDAAAERQRLVDAGQWTAHLAALPAGPSTDPARSQQLYHWFLAEDQVANMVTLFDKRFAIDLTAAAREISHEVVQGDTLSGLASAYLGDGRRWPEIYNHGDNRTTIGDDPNLIYPGQELTIPAGDHDWDKIGIQRTWVICDQLPPADVAFTVEIMREGSTGGAGGAAGGGEITMSGGPDPIGDVDTGAFTDDQDPMRGLNVFDGTMRHEIGHNVGEQGFDTSGGWAGTYGWQTFDSRSAISGLFTNTFLPNHSLALVGVAEADRDTRRTQIIDAIAGVSEWTEDAFQTAVNGVEANLWDQVSGEDLIVYILDRVEAWETPDDIGGNTFHAPYQDWDSFWQGCPTNLYQNKPSTYAMRSSMEWFAEVYAVFYADADRPDGQVGALLETVNPALARDFRATIHGRHNLPAETGQTTGAPAPAAGTAPSGS